MHLRFDGVSALRIAGVGGALIQITGFDVTDISDRQWEGKHWEIEDFENGVLHFYAASVSIVAIEDVAP